jgi:hypothetical protein
MIIVVPSCLKDADGARTRSDQNLAGTFFVDIFRVYTPNHYLHPGVKHCYWQRGPVPK